MSAGKFGECRQMMDPLGLDRSWPRWFVPFRPRFAFREQPLLELRDNLGILAMGGDDDAQPPGQGQREEQLGVVDAERALVGEKDFEGRRAVGDDALQEFGRLVVPAGHPHVEGVIAGRSPGRLGFP